MQMRAVRFHEYGESEKMTIESVPRPEPKDGEVLVRVHYAGVNPIDWKLRSGMYKDFMPTKFPSTPGREFSGVIEATGSGANGFSEGQRVFGPANGTYAEYVVVKGDEVATIPDNVSFEAAASVPLGALTAWHMVEDAGISAGQRVVVIGAAGGVGLYAAQFAKLKGAKVVGVASSANQSFIESLGAEPVDYTAGPVSSRVHDADIVIDTAGGAALDGAYALLKRGGLLLTCAGQPSEEKAKEHGITARSSGNRGPAPLRQIAELLGKGELVTEIEHVYDLSEAAAAQDKSQTGHGRGRILLKV
ncbi:NADP-dependent oxidoreductase [Salinispira pacifica]